jgi:hypothetical protein
VVPRCNLDDATWEQGKEPTRTVYVSRTPGGGTPDGSQARPFPSLLAASPMIGPGVRILLAPGEYEGVTFTDKRGTADAPIWIEGPASGLPARIVGGTGPGLHVTGGQYWVVRNLEVSNLTQLAGINFDDGMDVGSAHHVIVDRVTVSGVTIRPCLLFSGVTDVTVRNSVLSSSDRGVMMVGVQRAVIGRTSISAMTTAGVALAAGSADIEVRQNVISSVAAKAIWIGGDSSGEQFRPRLTAATGNTEARDIRVFDNVLESVNTAISCSNCGSSLVAHNLIRGVSNNVLSLNQSYPALVYMGTTYRFAPAGGVRLVNNAIEGGSNADGFNANGTGTAPDTCTFSHNMWLKDGGAWTPLLPTPEAMGFYGKASRYRAGGQLCASDNSPAAGAATPLREVPGTLQGECRGTPPSIGPSEPDPGC